MRTIEERRQIPVKEAYDVIVAGGGIAGVAAALEAARQGLSVLLLEKSCVLGGLATLGLINFYEPLCDGDGEQIVTGIAEELLRLSIEYGYDTLPDIWRDEGVIEDNPGPRYATIYDPAIFSLAMTDLLLKHGVDIKFDIIASMPVMEDDRCLGVITESKSFRVFHPAKVLIDATGDADIVHRAGLPTRDGSTYQTYWAHGSTFNSMERALESRNMARLQATIQTGSNLFGHGHPEDMPLHEGISHEVVNKSLITGQKMMFEKILERPKEERSLFMLPGMPQLRKTRCLVGAKTFVAIDGQRFDDTIGATGDFRYRGRRYEIPAGVLYNAACQNILAAGRVVSAKDDGWEVSRVIPTAALTGQATAIYAHVMVNNELAAADVDVKQVQRLLLDAGVRIKI